MEIYEILTRDHDILKGMLNELITLNKESPECHELIEQIKDELVPHSRAEEAVFYNSLRMIEPAKDMIMHSYREHMEAEAMLKTLQMKELVKADWKKTARKLKAALEHHMAEEEGRIFAAARQVFTREEAIQFSEVFQKMKFEIKDESFVGTTMDLIKNLMPPRFVTQNKMSSTDPR